MARANRSEHDAHAALRAAPRIKARPAPKPARPVLPLLKLIVIGVLLAVGADIAGLM